jgi:diguanylate cyclase (GGDEF)-like protein
MADYYPLLQRQISELLNNIDLHAGPWPEFLAAVNQAYHKFDHDQRTLEHSLTLSSEELVLANEEMRAVFQAIPDQLFHFDRDGRIITYKAGNSEQHYLRDSKLINRSLKEVFNREVTDKFLTAINEVALNVASLVFEFVVIHERRVYYYEARMMRIKNQQVIALVRDITERKQAEEQISYLAYHDNLTGLPNNRLFKDRLKQSIAHAERNKTKIAVMFLDLDRFKLINDSMGHDIGDKLLQVIGDRLMEGVRRQDSVGINISHSTTSVARLGGDEFTILLEDITSINTINVVAKRLIDIIAEPMLIDAQEVFTSTSIGISIYPNDGNEAEILLKHADTAMYHAKKQGRNNYQFFDESMNLASIEQLAIETNLRKAIENNELILHYQPQVDVRSGQIVGMEALLRWKHPTKGFISPAVFIPVAEETGQIAVLGEWVIRQACRQGADWESQGYKPVCISVNLSAKQLREERLNEIIARILFETGMNPKYLGLELTESAIIIDPELALSRLHNIKSLGVKLSLDDFGTGYSSLSYLKRFPIDTLKIDQSFIRDILVERENAALVKAIISMAHSLDMDVVAEGVEVQEQLEYLGANGCDTIQGFLFSRPLPADEIAKMLPKAGS